MFINWKILQLSKNDVIVYIVMKLWLKYCKWIKKMQKKDYFMLLFMQICVFVDSRVFALFYRRGIVFIIVRVFGVFSVFGLYGVEFFSFYVFVLLYGIDFLEGYIKVVQRLFLREELIGFRKGWEGDLFFVNIFVEIFNYVLCVLIFFYKMNKNKF